MKKITKKTKGFSALLIAALALASVSPIKSQDMKPVFGADERIKSWEQHLELKRKSIYKNLEWRAVGPEFQGGRVESIASHPDEPFTIYLGVGSGNIWKTTNHGTTWNPIFEDQPTFAIGCVALAPSNPDIIWVGTGEVLMARSSYAGLGIFKSEDAGKNWQRMGLEGTYHIPKVIIDPENPNVVYAASIGHNYTDNEERGLYKTINGGESWEKILYISEKAGIIDVVMDPSDSRILYAASWERGRKAWDNTNAGEGSGLYKTTDGGKTWEELENGLPIGEHLGRIGLCIAPSNPDIIYALLENQAPAKDWEGRIGGELYRSDDKGESWQKTHSDKFITGINYSFCDVRIAPDNEDEVFIAGWKLVHSTDAGKSWEFTSDTVVHLLSHDIRVMHLDMHDLWIDPVNPDRILLANDGGFYCSWDRSKNWLHYNNIPIGEFYAVSVDNAIPYNIYGGTQDDAALFGPGTHSLNDRLTKFGVEDPWQHVYVDQWGGGDSYFTEVDPTNPDVIYYEHQFGMMRRKNMKTGETKTIQPKASEGEEPYRYNWMTPFVISKYNPYTIYYGTRRLLKSVDRGDNWEIISPDLTTSPGNEKQGNVPYGTITTISESPLKKGLIIIGTDDGNVQVTQDEGISWTLVNKGLPDKWVTRVRASRHDANTIYATLTGYRDDDFQSYIYMSTDLGKSWKPISGNMPPEPVNVIIEDPRDPDILYTGTDLSAYVTLNRGKEWISLSNHLPTCAVYDLAIQERELDLVAGTHGRSIFVLDIEKIVK